ncbi:mutS domain V domain-containing protein [Ditylenchus destructor]|uniref:DNA mismatch repair protein n=1 Tax=Ditylenchus destructor TaxID=166010 RepID=A0AAD4NCH6_9BILA|nr:mutS domain V domain-containing protein [Ditylenchus destructor]
MSGSKNQRQSNLFSFFKKENKTPLAEKNVNDHKSCNFPSAAENKSRNRAFDGLNKSHTHAADENDTSINSLEVSPISSAAQRTKRRRVILSDDEDEIQEAKPKCEIQTPQKRTKPMVSPSRSINSTPKQSVALNKSPASSSKLQLKNANISSQDNEIARSFITSFQFQDSEDNGESSGPPITPSRSVTGVAKSRNIDTICSERSSNSWPHLSYTFLKPEKIRDANFRRPDDPDYNPRTLFVPEEFLKKQTPAQKQWWDIKSKNYDTVLFFKVGKFYELYHWDAVTAVENLNLAMMKAKEDQAAHCGFPEMGYGRFADQLLNRGYKVARVEQTETNEQMKNRVSLSNSKEKAMRREVCNISTAATRTYGYIEGTDDRENDGLQDTDTKYLMSLCERIIDGTTSYGLCFVDCSTGKFHLCQFDDDKNQSTLRTVLAHTMPSQLLYEKNGFSRSTSSLLSTVLCGIPQQALARKIEFLPAETALAMLMDDVYLGTSFKDWPDALRKTCDFNSPVPKPFEEHKLSLSALGAIIWYLKTCLVDVDLVTMKQFYQYVPPNRYNEVQFHGNYWKNRRMILDGISLQNLHVLPASSLDRARNAQDLSVMKCSLFNTINMCVTPFGIRLLRQWICSPICDPMILQQRQATVKALVKDESQAFLQKSVDIMRSLPDLEKLFQRIHTIGSKYRATDHPDSRAQIFEVERYNKRKIKDLCLMLDGLDNVAKLIDLYNNYDVSEKALDKCLGEEIPEFFTDLEHFKNAFDRNIALESGVIVPRRQGVDSLYDEVVFAVKECERELELFLENQCVGLNCQGIRFTGKGKSRYTMEIPTNVTSKLGQEFIYLSEVKGYKRYTTEELKQLIEKLIEAENHRDIVSAEVTRRVFSDFDNRKEKWAGIVKRIAEFDCLTSLARYSRTSGLSMCFPEFVFDSEKPILDIRMGYHPSLVASSFYGSKSGNKSSTDFNYIPNDCILDDSDGNSALVMLLTGPNMGGKSTLMRQTSALVILAQVGSMVPAASMRLTPVDRIFCRIGASDSIMTGQSTFFVELNETNMILTEATRHSLVLIDELGRGTSTYDGTAIAAAVLKHIANNIKCRTLFSTHYHALCGMVKDNPNVRLAHMACIAENETSKDPTEDDIAEQEITFLYTLVLDKPCPKSYGFYTAKVAGINIEIIRKAIAASRSMNDSKKL